MYFKDNAQLFFVPPYFFHRKKFVSFTTLHEKHDTVIFLRGLKEILSTYLSIHFLNASEITKGVCLDLSLSWFEFERKSLKKSFLDSSGSPCFLEFAGIHKHNTKIFTTHDDGGGVERERWWWLSKKTKQKKSIVRFSIK